MNQTHVLGDWGTSRLRLFRMINGVVADRLEGPGIGALPARAAVVLSELLAPWRNDDTIGDVTLCGMAGARGGLVEAGYLACPTDTVEWLRNQTSVLIDGVRVSVLSGLRHHDANGAPDVMRGEETQIFGAMALDPTLVQGSTLFVLPGTHSKWVDVEDKVVRGFRTFPTGELYALLAERSTLAGKSVSGRGDEGQGFARGLARSGEPLTSALFEARAGQLLDGRSRTWALGYLSGLLIGAEVAAQSQPGLNVVLIGDPALCDRYALALTARGCSVRLMDGDDTVLAGLKLARGEAA